MPRPTTGRFYEGPGRANLSPRAGLAWDVFGDGSTSVRGGYGLYFGTTVQQNLIVTVTNPPVTPRFVIPNPTFPSPPFERGIGNTIRPMQWDLQSPRLHVWNVSAQRALPGDDHRDRRLCGVTRHAPVPQHRRQHSRAVAGPDGRPFFAAGLPRPNRSFGTIELKSSDGDSWYRALLVELRRTLAERALAAVLVHLVAHRGHDAGVDVLLGLDQRHHGRVPGSHSRTTTRDRPTGTRRTAWS